MARRTNTTPTNQGTTVVDLDIEESVGSQGTYGKVVPVTARVNEARKRKAPEEHPACPHCGKLHWNAAGAAINMECLWRQYCLATGRMDSPYDRLPVFEEADMEPWTEWKNTRKKSRKNPLAYGKMPAASGEVATYSALRAKQKAETAEDTVKAVAGEKKKAGHPKKEELVDPLAAKRAARKTAKAEPEPVAEAPAKQRGRPKKQVEPVAEAPTKKRGRPAKIAAAAVAEPTPTTTAKRGRPKKQAEPELVMDDFFTEDAPAKGKKGGAKKNKKTKKSK